MRFIACFILQILFVIGKLYHTRHSMGTSPHKSPYFRSLAPSIPMGNLRSFLRGYSLKPTLVASSKRKTRSRIVLQVVIIRSGINMRHSEKVLCAKKKHITPVHLALGQRNRKVKDTGTPTIEERAETALDEESSSNKST